MNLKDYIIKILEKENEDFSKKSEDLIVNKEINDYFKKEYAIIFKNNSFNLSLYKKSVLEIITKSLLKTEFHDDKHFLNDLNIFVYLVFLIIEDDFYSKKIIKKDLTNFDECVLLVENMKNFHQTMKGIAKNKKFSEDENDNLIAHFIFLEENGIDFIGVVGDFIEILKRLNDV